MNDIVKQTSYLPEKCPLKLRKLAIELGYTEQTFPRCQCGKLVTWDKQYWSGFLKYCSPKCANQARSIQIDKDWLIEQRINKKLSYDDIAILANCTAGVIKRACKKYKLPMVRYNESNAIARSFLRNKEWLYQKHVVEKLKVTEIAEQIASSPATVSVWLSNHQITTNNVNSYPREFNKVSDEEKQLVDYIRSLVPDIKTNDRSTLNGFELDIIIPSHKIAIEYNGIYSHIFRPDQSTFAARKDRRYHLFKTEKCREQGYQLIHIWSDDWNNRQSIVKSILAAKLGRSTIKIGARKCQIRTVEKNAKKQFLGNNHLQGADHSSSAVGLYYQDQLVALITFAKSRYNKKYDWELMRFCVKNNHNIAGAFSRLLKFWRNNNEGSIISYADYSRSNGDVYKKNGFQLIKKNQPSYYYVNLNKGINRLHRSNFTKSKLGGEGTESEQMQQLGYHKIYDCGTLVFVLE